MFKVILFLFQSLIWHTTNNDKAIQHLMALTQLQIVLMKKNEESLLFLAMHQAQILNLSKNLIPMKQDNLESEIDL